MKGIIFTENGVKCIFEEAEELENIQSGESADVIFGKIQKWFSDIHDFINDEIIKFSNKAVITPGTGEYSLIIGGTNNTASGGYSAAIGKGNTASEAGAFAVGHSNTASSPDAIAIGYRNNASQTYSVAIGGDNTAAAPGAVAIGYGNNATDLGAVAMGKGCLANSKARAVLGRYNRIDSTDYSFVVGNGTSTDARSNALTLDLDSNLWTAGDVTATDSNGNSVSLCDAAQSISKSQNSITELQKSLGMTKGKNLLKNTVGTTTQKGITFKHNSDGSVTCNGTATADTNYRIVITLPQNTSFILSGCPAGGSTSTYNLFAMDADTWTKIYRDTGNGKTFNTGSCTEWHFIIRISNGQTVNDLTFYPMLRNASIADSTYTPYADDLQTQINELKAHIVALTSAATMADMQGSDTE